jgi:hypothetical protein
MNDNWKKECLWATILYRALECGEELEIVTSGQQDFIEKDLLEMRRDGYLKDEGTHLVPSEKAHKFRAQLVAMLDQLTNFEIFAALNLGRSLTEQEGPENEDGGIFQVYDHIYDPRFQKEGEWEDMRLAMMTFLSKNFSEAPRPTDFEGNVLLDPHRIVFLQMLADGKLKSETLWQDLRMGRFFKDVEAIVESAYQWQDVVEGADEEAASEIMREIWTAGQLELRKRKGDECSKCRIPLAVIEEAAKEEGVPFYTKCPEGGDCAWHPDNIVQDEDPDDGGQMVEETAEFQVIEASMRSDPYGYYYEPYGFYDPYDPFVDYLAFAVVCDVWF